MNTGAGKPVEYEIEVYGAGTAVELAHVDEVTRPRWVLNEEPSSDAPFGFLYASNYGYHDRVNWSFEWDKAVERWLMSGRRRIAAHAALLPHGLDAVQRVRFAATGYRTHVAHH